jgi:DNA replication initiation complex subunit (GINS family)
MRDVMADKRGDMGYEEIMTLFRLEYRSPQLTKVDSSLYDKMNHYIRSLRKESERELAVSPSSQASMMLNDQLKKATEKVKRVYELRQRKISLLALRKVAGDNPETANLTPDELVLFSSLISVLGAHRDNNADFDGTGPRFSNPKDIVDLPDAPPKKACVADEEAVGKESEEEQLVLVRVLEDVPTFAGVDRDYTLKKEDVVSLPMKIADTLASHGKIRLVNVPS